MTVALSTTAPLLIAPAMESNMYAHPATQTNLRLLRERGARHDLYGRDRVYLEVQRHFDADQAHRNRDVLAQAEALGVGVVATNDVRYATPAQRIVHDVLTCARERALS